LNYYRLHWGPYNFFFQFNLRCSEWEFV